MDYLDPKNQRSQAVRLLTGYALIGVAVLIATLILLYQAYGFGLGKGGQVIQNGLIFVSSNPASARIYLDGKLNKASTNTKLQLQAGQYTATLTRSGYNNWQRIITIVGGSVQHFDYPKLFPTKVISTAVKAYPEIPGFATESLDRHWLVVQAQAASPQNFDLFDLSDPKKVVETATTISLPDDVVTNAKSGIHSWKLVEWSTDNRHILVQHTYTVPATATDPASQASEYIIIDRQTPDDSVNLTKTLGLTADKELTLYNQKFDSYYIYDTTSKTLGTTSIDAAGKVTPLLDAVLAYKSYGTNMMLYMTDEDPSTSKPTPAGTVLSVLRDGDQSYSIREHSATGPFLLDLVQYSGNWFVAAGASSDNKIYIYENPETIRKSSATAVLVPIQILHVTAPNELAFSSNSQLIMAESGASFADYDEEYDEGYNFTSKYALEAPAVHATWMDDHRLTYISGDKLIEFDYDNINANTIAPASPNYLPFFDRNYHTVYTLVPTIVSAGQPASGGMTLMSTSLLTPADQ
jgi:hypothetical protein